MNARGVFIRESLIDERLPGDLAEMIVDQHSHMLGGVEPVQILVTSSPSKRLPEMAMAVSFSLLPQRYYAHFIDGNLLWVVFPTTICYVRQDDSAAADRARLVGRTFAIPDSQMPFEGLFEHDHPNTVRGGIK